MRAPTPAQDSAVRIVRAAIGGSAGIEAELSDGDRIAVPVYLARRMLERQYVDVSMREVVEAAAELRSEAGIIPESRDVAWATLKRLTSGRRSHAELKSAFDSQARFLALGGRDHRESHRESHRHELLAFAQSGIERVEILGVVGCRQCKRQHGQRMTVAEALERMPLPCAECTNTGVYGSPFGFCRCLYVPHIGQ